MPIFYFVKAADLWYNVSTLDSIMFTIRADLAQMQEYLNVVLHSPT